MNAGIKMNANERFICDLSMVNVIHKIHRIYMTNENIFGIISCIVEYLAITQPISIVISTAFW